MSNLSISPTIAGTGANGVGQFINFNWTTTNATAFNVTPTINGDDQSLPLQGPYQDTGAPTQTTTFTAIASNGSTQSQPATVTLTMVPVNLTASANNIPAGNSVTLTYTGPNNNSTWGLLVNGNQNPTQLPTPTCSGNRYWDLHNSRAKRQYDVHSRGDGSCRRASRFESSRHHCGRRDDGHPDSESTEFSAGQQFHADLDVPECHSCSISPGLGNEPLQGSAQVTPSQTTTYTATATSIYPGTPPVTASVTVTVNTGGLNSLNHIIYMLQENRAFDNYFGVLQRS